MSSGKEKTFLINVYHVPQFQGESPFQPLFLYKMKSPSRFLISKFELIFCKIMHISYTKSFSPDLL